MTVLALHEDAQGDLAQLRNVNPREAALITVALQELSTDPELANNLLDHGFGAGGTSPYHVSKWLRHWNNGRDIWRLKSLQLEQMGLRIRIVYAYVPIDQRFYVLAIVPRGELDYDNAQHPLALRIRAAYDNL